MLEGAAQRAGVAWSEPVACAELARALDIRFDWIGEINHVFVAGDDVWDWTTELAELPTLLAEKTKAPSVVAGPTDLVIDPTNLWLTIHESVGHATELDRALGYEANYAGTSFATIDKLSWCSRACAQLTFRWC